MLHKTEEDTSFYCIGLNYKKADVETRSNFSLSAENQEKLLQKAKDKNKDGVLILSTCNRVEIIGFAKHPFQLISLLCEFSHGTVDEFAKVSYVYKNSDAVAHFIKIATGLDSQILGDYEIVGQVKDAFQQAKNAGTINAYMERLYNVALQASKEVKNTTSLSSGTTSVSYAAIQYIKDSVKDLENKNILVYGLGSIGESTVKSAIEYLKTNQVSVVNRTNEKAVKLEKEIAVKAVLHDNLQTDLDYSDVIIVATDAGKSILNAKHFTTDKKQIIIDLSIPANVDTNINDLNNKKVINVDVISAKTKETFENRKEQIPVVEQIIEKYKNEFYEWLIFRKSTPAINALKKSLETLQKDTIKIHSKKHQNSNVEYVEEATSFLVNKIVAKFAQHLREDEVQANKSIQVMKRVFKATIIE